MTFQRKIQYSVEACKMDVISHQLPRYPWDETTMYSKVCTAKCTSLVTILASMG